MQTPRAFGGRAPGFTLIELLVVIAIIAILASIILASLGAASAKSRDTRRMSDLRELRNALEMYYTDNGGYPNCPWVWSPVNDSVESTWNTTGCLVTAIRPYISRMPVDPKNNAENPWTPGNYSYRYGSSADLQSYDLLGQLEDTNSPYRCGVVQWPSHVARGGASWCSGDPTLWSPQIYADH